MPKYKTFFPLENGAKLDFILDIGKRSRLSMSFRDGMLEIKVPYGCPKDKIYAFITDNIDWINQRTDKYLNRPGLPKTYTDGEVLRLMGENIVLTTVSAQRYFPPRIENGKLLIAVSKTSDKAYIKSQTDKFISELTLSEIKESMNRMMSATGLTPEKVTVKPMTASWGRCISNRHISINSKLVMYPKECMDYVCLHELCHLVHMDHSKDFWALVEKYCPEWKRIRDEMKE